MLATRSSKFDAQHLGRLWVLVAQNAHHGSRGNFLCIYWQPFKTILLPNRFDSAKPSHLQYMIILQYPFSTGNSQPSQVSALDTKNDAATLGFNVCRGTRITETKRTAITRRPHNPSIYTYIYMCVWKHVNILDHHWWHTHLILQQNFIYNCMHTTVGLWEQTGGKNALCSRVAQSQQAVHKVSQADQV